jgi:hypothetical protein
VFDFVDDALVADLTPEEFEMLSNDMAAAQLDAVDDGEPTEVISVAVGGPGAVTPNPTETGFRTQLGPGDELTLNIAPDLPGNILAVHSVFDLNEDDDSAVGLRYALSFYMLPPGQMLPEDNVTGTEAGSWRPMACRSWARSILAGSRRISTRRAARPSSPTIRARPKRRM